MTDPLPPTGRLVILWSNGTSYVTDMPEYLAMSILTQVATGRWANWTHGPQRGAINPDHVADITFNLYETAPK